MLVSTLVNLCPFGIVCILAHDLDHDLDHDYNRFVIYSYNSLLVILSSRRESNPQHLGWKPNTLPIELLLQSGLN